jgi:Na+/H+ antiporter NhaD/arsenite permease-like protein
MLLALAIFVVTIMLVIWQPKGLGIGWSAMGGAAAALLIGVVSLPDVPVGLGHRLERNRRVRRDHHHQPAA